MNIRERHAGRAAELLPDSQLIIDGESVTATSDGYLEHVDPSTGEVLAQLPVAGEKDVDRAVGAARRAFPSWRHLPADQRRGLLFGIAQAIKRNQDELAEITALEAGVPVSVNAISMAADQFEYYAGWCDKFAGELVSSYPGRALDYVSHEPYGPVAALITWNGPVINAAMKLAPALAAGNTVVIKSAESAPFSLMRLGEIMHEAGLPAGVVNILSGGPSTAQSLIRHPDIRKISFTGGSEIAKEVMAAAAETLTPVCLELGGKSANLIFEDADLDSATQMAAFMSTIALSGQGCLYPTRLLVQHSVYDEVVDRVRAVAESPVIGDPLDASTTMGPVINKRAAERIGDYISEASKTARLVTGGDRLDGDLAPGYFIRPTVLADVENSSRLAQEEVFGPVLAVLPFDTEQEAVAKANATAYGLAGYLHTRDLSRAHRVAGELDAGYISVNGFPPMTATAPFGGTKGSGFGREGGRAGLEEWVQHKNVYIPLD
jgi:aldehyde dehydrogenase (NAD+)